MILNSRFLRQHSNKNLQCYFSTKKLTKIQWPLMRAEMINFFKKHHTNDNSENHSLPVELNTCKWPPFCRKELLRESGLVPAILYKYGESKRFCLYTEQLSKYIFEESEGHISMYFSARPFHLMIDHKKELSIASKVIVHPVKKEIYSIEFSRHIPGKISIIDVPCNLLGLLACPAYLKGNQVELALPKIRCEVAGTRFPPPFQIDVSNFEYKSPYSAIYLSQLENHLFNDGTVRFHKSYNKQSQEVVWAYPPGSLPEVKLPPDWPDPNFLNRYGNSINLTYKGYRPKQS